MNCKPGDLAIVIHASKKKNDWIGRIVSVVGPCFAYEGYWVVDWLGPRPVSCVAAVQSVRDCDLRPVSGIPDTEDTTTDTPIKELA